MLLLRWIRCNLLAVLDAYTNNKNMLLQEFLVPTAADNYGNRRRAGASRRHLTRDQAIVNRTGYCL